MKKELLLDIAKYILFPYKNFRYSQLYNDIDNVYKLPIVDEECLYINTKSDKHHYTTEYHRKYVLPLMSKVLNFDFNINDFEVINIIKPDGDFSYLKPIENYSYTYHNFERDEIMTNCTYNDLLNPTFFEHPEYRTLIRHSHECSKIINNSINTNRILYISGDSLVIPDIAVLSTYFKEVWYFVNRTGKYLADKKNNIYKMNKDKVKKFANMYKDVDFTDMLVSFYTNPIDWYLDINLM